MPRAPGRHLGSTTALEGRHICRSLRCSKRFLRTENPTNSPVRQPAHLIEELPANVLLSQAFTRVQNRFCRLRQFTKPVKFDWLKRFAAFPSCFLITTQREQPMVTPQFGFHRRQSTIDRLR